MRPHRPVSPARVRRYCGGPQAKHIAKKRQKLAGPQQGGLSHASQRQPKASVDEDESVCRAE